MVCSANECIILSRLIFGTLVVAGSHLCIFIVYFSGLVLFFFDYLHIHRESRITNAFCWKRADPAASQPIAGSSSNFLS